MEYEAVIGLEVHSQLLTRSKMFCRCPALDYARAEPNTRVCPICLGMPGVLPVINRRAVEYTIMTGLALNCEIARFSKFDRKNYMYPDLMKNYQISQYDLPLCRNGWLDIELNGRSKRVGIIRVHLEEDTARLLHRTDPSGETYSLIDVNRSGVPLLEIVTAPDLRSPEEARAFLVKLRTILQYLGVSSGSMEEGSLRCDANVSVRPVGEARFGTKVEVKNMNSFRSVYRALAYEIERQIGLLKAGRQITQETRGWLEDKGITVPQRTKEYAHDYRYFPEPDLPPLTPAPEWVESIRQRLPELPDARRDRFMAEYGLGRYDAALLTEEKALADFFEAAVKLTEGRPALAKVPLPQRAKSLANWLLNETRGLLEATGRGLAETGLGPEHYVELLELLEEGTLSSRLAKQVFEEVFRTGKLPRQVVAEQGLVRITDVDQLLAVIDRVIAENPAAVADYQKGKAQALTFLVGQVMKATRGKADPALTNQLLRERLGGSLG